MADLFKGSAKPLEVFSLADSCRTRTSAEAGLVLPEEACVPGLPEIETALIGLVCVLHILFDMFYLYVKMIDPGTFFDAFEYAVHGLKKTSEILDRHSDIV